MNDNSREVFPSDLNLAENLVRAGLTPKSVNMSRKPGITKLGEYAPYKDGPNKRAIIIDAMPAMIVDIV